MKTAIEINTIYIILNTLTIFQSTNPKIIPCINNLITSTFIVFISEDDAHISKLTHKETPTTAAALFTTMQCDVEDANSK